jgi:hypothetical protein
MIERYAIEELAAEEYIAANHALATKLDRLTRESPRARRSFAGAGGEPRVAGGHSSVVPVRLPCGGRRRRLSLGTGPLGVLTACWIRAELDDRMRLNNWSIAASYDTARYRPNSEIGLVTDARRFDTHAIRPGRAPGWESDPVAGGSDVAVVSKPS